MIRRILVPLDGSRLAECAVAHAVAVARSFPSRILLLRVLEPSHGEAGVHEMLDWRLHRAESRTYLEELRQRIAKLGISASWFLEEGNSAEQIVDFAPRHAVDLTVLSAFGRGGVTPFGLGSIVRKVIAGFGRSIMIVRPSASGIESPEVTPYRRVLAPLDGSQRAEWALTLAASIAQANDAELLIPHVVVTPPDMPGQLPRSQTERELAERVMATTTDAAKRYLDEKCKQLPETLRVRTRVVVGQPVSQALEELAEEACLVVINAHGHSADDHHPYGSIAEALLARCPRSVIVCQDLLRDLESQHVVDEAAHRPLRAHAEEIGSGHSRP